MPIAFYCRAKPQECDAFTIFDEARRVFIGYPLVRQGEVYNSRALFACLVNPTCSQDVLSRGVGSADRWAHEQKLRSKP